MLSPLRRQNQYRLLPLLFALSAVTLLACTVGALWPTSATDRSGALRVGLEQAFLGVIVDRTTQPELMKMGFDPGQPDVRSLSGLGVQEFFMPRSSRDFDHLAPAVRGCFDTEDRCTALVIPLGAPVQRGGFFAARAAVRPAGQIVLLLRSGRVAYKEMRGE